MIAEIDLPDELITEIEADLKLSGQTFKQFVQQALRHELQKKHESDLKTFFATLQPLESFSKLDTIAYVDDLRGRSRLINE